MRSAWILGNAASFCGDGSEGEGGKMGSLEGEGGG